MPTVCENAATNETKKNASVPATMRRPGAETKVGGSPFTTIGSKLSGAVTVVLLLSLTDSGVEAVEAQQHTAAKDFCCCKR